MADTCGRFDPRRRRHRPDHGLFPGAGGRPRRPPRQGRFRPGGVLGRRRHHPARRRLPPARTPIDRLRALSAADVSRTVAPPARADRHRQRLSRLRRPGTGRPGEHPSPPRNGAAEGIAFRELEGDALRAVEPALSPALPRACHLPDMAQVRNPRHLKALHRRLPEAKASASIRTAPRPASSATGRRIDAVQTDQGPLSAGQFLLAAGAWTDGLLERSAAGSASVRCAARSPCSRPTTRGASGPAPGQALPGAAHRRPGAGRLDGGGRRLRRPAHRRRGRRTAGLRRRTGPALAARPWSAAGRGCGPAAPMACPSSARRRASPISSWRPATTAPASSCRRPRAW